MDLFVFLIRSARRMVLGTIVASVLAGVLGASVIALIHSALRGHGLPQRYLLLAFLGVVALKIATQSAANIMLVRFAQDTILRLCNQLCEKVLSAPFDRLEVLGGSRLLATLTDDVATLSGAVQAIPSLATNLAVIIGCSAYLAWLSPRAFLLCAVGAGIGILGYHFFLKRAQSSIQAARDGRDRLFADFRTLLEGLKELKLNRARRTDFVRRGLGATMEELRRVNLSATTHYNIADAWSQLVFFGLIAMLLFAAPAYSILDSDAGTGYVFAALYIMTPIWWVVGTVPTFMRGRVSLEKMRQLGDALVADDSLGKVAGSAAPRAAPLRIELDEIRYSYPAPSPEDAPFMLGPISLELRSGEITFVTGGNGSGKSTLAKVITGLYAPHGGSIRLNGAAVTDENREQYRQNFCAVFADFHLFSCLYGIDATARAEDIDRYLALLHMSGKVRIDEGRFSTIALSSGQRKRLALLTAYLEDRPVYVFDEWAADQDPTYKEIFYSRLLPELRTRGKCVIVITHDDRYFHRGDRLIKLDGMRGDEGVERAAAIQRATS